MADNALQFDKVPQHVAIIMDGNGRWAQQRDLPRLKGHEEGAQSVRAALRACSVAGVKYLTLYAFSTENWKRPPQEVQGLMKLLVASLEAYEEELHEHKVRLRVMGQFERLPKPVQKRLQATIDATADYTEHTLVIALSYGARTELAYAARRIAEQVEAGRLKSKDITEDTVAANLYEPDIPDPELLIRTSGELRLSNFMLWQLSYAEFYVTDTLWPDFKEEQFYKAIQSFGSRDRRFGAVKK